MYSQVVGLLNHFSPFIVACNLQLFLLVGYGEDKMRKKDGIYLTPEKINYFYSTIVFGWPDVKRIDFTV